MKSRHRRLLIASLAALLLLVVGVGLRGFFGTSEGTRSEGQPPEDADPKTSARSAGGVASGTMSASLSAQAAATSAAPAPASAKIVLRSADDADRMARRHLSAIQAIGLPLPAGSPKPRVPLAKEELRQPPGQDHLLVVKFLDKLAARSVPGGGLLVSAAAPDPALQRVVEEYGLAFSPSQTASEEDLIRLEARALSNTQTEPADLGGMLSARPARADAGGVWAAAQALQNLDAVEFVTLASRDQPPPPPLPYDIAPTTALLTANQTYRTSDGINMDAAWAAYGARGRGVRITNCEYSFNVAHEDLRNRVSQQPMLESYYIVPPKFTDDHGTAVLGILGAAENAYGMTGMVPDASLRFYGEYSTVNGTDQYRAATVAAALATSLPGDVVLLEMQTTGYGATDEDPRYVPAEYQSDVWTVVKTGTDTGVHVVAAAGNGGPIVGEDLDSEPYAPYRARGDSGAILVGAATRERAKMGWSTYGARVNVQGWGDFIVASLGYGDLQTYGGDHNQKYSAKFAGTSSASPIVTSAVAAIESIARLTIGRPLTPAEMRQLLVSTGKPQTGDASKKIGPLPDVVAALQSKLAGFPTVSSAAPSAGSAGAPVVISGVGFAAATAVAFGGTGASFAVVNDTTINATVPAGARTGRVTVTTPAGKGAGATDFKVVAGAADPAATASPAGMFGFTASAGSPSAAQSFTVRGDNLAGDVVVTAPAGYEVSLDGISYAADRSLSPSAPADSAANYTTNWTSGANAGLGFGAWAMTFVQGTNEFAGNFVGNPADAGITGFGTKAFGLFANPSNSLAEVRADRALARPLRVGDTFTFRWAVNNDAKGPGSKGFVLYTGGAGMTEILRVEQGGYSGAVVFSTPRDSVDTGIGNGTSSMTWKFTRTANDSIQATSTGRDGGNGTVFTKEVTIPGAPDGFRWYAAQLDSSATAFDNNSRQPYFNDLGILSAFSGGGSVGAITVHVRLAADAPVGPSTGNITVASAGTPLAAVSASGIVDPNYETWARNFGLDPAGSGAQESDPDHDGLANRAEFLFGSDPTAPSTSLVQLSQTGNERILTFLALAAGATYDPQIRADLVSGSWSDAGRTPVQSTDQTGVPAGYRRMECTVPAAVRAFYRISAAIQ
jgi:hypothetical protein